MAAAADAWLDALDPGQCAMATGRAPSPDAGSDAERRRWFYTPTDHGGLTLGAQRPAQQRLAHQLVATGLSAAGYVTVATIIGLDNVLDYVEGWTVDWGRERGRDPGLYYLRVFGDPGGAAPWGWRFGGHHLSLNNFIADGEVRSMTPCFFGADPAASPLLGPAPLRPLGGAEDLARELVHSLDPGRAACATLLDRAPADIIGGNRAYLTDGDQMMYARDLWREPFTEPRLAERIARQDADTERASGYADGDHQRLALTSAPKGLPAADLDVGQRDLLRALLATYLGRVPDGLSPQDYRTGPAALLPRAGSAAADRIRQHPEPREPRPCGMARPGDRLRLRRPRGAPQRCEQRGPGTLVSHLITLPARGGPVVPRATRVGSRTISLASVRPWSRRSMMAWTACSAICVASCRTVVRSMKDSRAISLSS